MARRDTSTAAAAIRQAATPAYGRAADFDAMVERAQGKRFVLIGEASHGTHEFYRERAQLTKRLIRECGFQAVAVEADWPDALRVQRYVTGVSDDRDTVDALGDFKRFPAWMWRNADVLDFVGWLRAHNDDLDMDRPRVGFFGLDLYSLYGSIDGVLAHLRDNDPAAHARAVERYGCFERFDRDAQSYGYAARSGFGGDCSDAAIAQLAELQARRVELAKGSPDADERFFAEQNARVVVSAERYYRELLSDVGSWNLRDTHMADTLDGLAAHLEQRGVAPKVVVWAHNSHLGDARFTEFADRGELNLGQLVRERHPNDALLVGFTTFHGSVTAARSWGGDAVRMAVRPGMEGSVEDLFHEVGEERFLLELGELGEASGVLSQRLLERAIGVIYAPATERYSHYFDCALARQFDFVLHIDETRAVEPLERSAQWVHGELPETWPTSL